MGRVQESDLDPRVGSGYRKTRPEPDPLPFLVGLGQERYAEKPIIYIPLQFSISYIGIRAFIGCSRCHKHIWLVLNSFYAS